MKTRGLFFVTCAMVLLSSCTTVQPTATVSPPTPQSTSTPRQLPPDILTRTPLPPNWTEVPITQSVDNTQATPVPTVIEETAVWNGFVQIPWGVADAGNWFLYATAQITLNWDSPPEGCDQYDFIVEDSLDDRTLLGTDSDPSDGVTLDWEVPEGLDAMLFGEAHCENDEIRRTNFSSAVYSGTSPPAGVCTIASGTIGAVDLYSTPSLSSETDGFIVPGVFAQVLERTTNGWYRIDEGATDDWPEGTAPKGPAWASSEYPLKYFGPCDSLPIAD